VRKLLPAIALLVAASKASAQLVYEPFDYAGSSLDSQINPGNGLPWSKMSFDPDNDDEIAVTNSNLASSGLSFPTGKSVTFGGTGASERLSLGQDFDSGTFYYSLTFQVTSPLTATPAFIAGFSNASGEVEAQPQSVGTRLYLKQGPNSTAQNPTFSVGVSKNSSTPGDITYDGEFALNTPVMVVGSYGIVGTAANEDDQAKLWVNPSLADLGAATAPAATLTPTSAGSDLPNPNTNGSRVSAFVLRQATSAVPNVQVDELRIDRTWAQVTPPVGIAWNHNGGGAWSEDAKWSTFARPNNPNEFVTFGSVATGAATINVDGTYALRTINFTGNGPYTLSGSGMLNFSGSAAVNVMGGSQTISTVMNLGGDLEASVRTGSTLTLNNVTSNNNSLLKAGAGTLQLNIARFNNLDIVGGKVKIAQSANTLSTVSKINGLNLNTANSTLDLTNNDMVVNYTGSSPLGTWNGSAYTGLIGAIRSGRNGGAWNGLGIITSMTNAAAGSPRTTLGIGEASALLALSGSATATWRGQVVDATSVLMKYTYSGDANLSGNIDADDYFIINRNYNKSGTVFGYSSGDFNYDGVINGDDFFLIDSTFTTQGGPLGALPVEGASAIPEPAGLMLASLLVTGSILRRRRRLA
jgi:hypothetical protein